MTSHLKTRRLIAISTALTLAAGSAGADDSGFAAIDSDGSGGLSFAELQAVDFNMTAEIFAAYDADNSSELSAEEYAAWASSVNENSQ